MRTFIALEIPHAVKLQLQALQDRLKELPSLREQPSLLRWTNTQNMHLTLRFLGETEKSQRDLLQKWPDGHRGQSPPLLADAI